ncbi:MAG: polysaccharide deacetylase family protein [Clostridia bacterium]|nr:polysaccharide deacetylase family protein [Clostridia bacterium]
MMKKIRRFLAFPLVWLLLFALLLLPMFITIFAVYGDNAPGSADVPTLFYNDTVWRMDDYYPALGFVTGGTDDFWIPLSFFEEFENIKVRRGPSKNVTSFIISDTASGKYLSFDTANNEYAQTERNTYLFIRTTLFSKERYLPMRDICAYFGWSFEISEDKNTVRITDGGQKKSFASLLEAYLPEETTQPVTQAPVTLDTDENHTVDTDIPGYNIYRSDVVYLTFEDIDDVCTPQILEQLAEYGAQATFFVTGEQLVAYADVIAQILSEGHAIGLHTMTGNEYDVATAESLIAALDTENDLLYAMTKRKTRLARLPEGSHSGVLHYNHTQKKTVSDAGYVLWDWNIESMDTNEAYTADMIYEKIEKAMKVCYSPTVRFHCTQVTTEVLPRLLARIAEVPVIEAKKITEAVDNVVFP